MTSPHRPVARSLTLVTGGNRGPGYETARRLLAAGHTVLIGSPDHAKGRAAAARLDAEFVDLDISDTASVDAAAANVDDRHGRLDVLINNASIVGPIGPLAGVRAQAAGELMSVNLLGIVPATHAFLPLLRRSTNPRIVNVTSGLGSFARIHDPSVMESTVPPMVYSAAKAAVSMLTVQYARAEPIMRINAADPGYTATDRNGGPGGPGQSVSNGTDAIVSLATLERSGPTGTFIDRDEPVAW